MVEHQVAVGITLGVDVTLLAEAGGLEELEGDQRPQSRLTLGHRHR